MNQIPIFILGIGAVGQTLLRMIFDTRRALMQRTGLQVTVVGLADSAGMVLDADGLSNQTVAAALDVKATGQKLSTLQDSQPPASVQGALMPGTIVVDATASIETRPLLLDALARECGVVLANKHPVGGPLEHARAFLEHPRVRMEATVGAGLPVIQTLNNLMDTDDAVVSIEGCLSGTLGYLCGELEDGVPFSEAVARAREMGYTEPDPREDLGGRDVARKAIIMGRIAGWALEMGDLTVEALYPEAAARLSIEEFLQASAVQNQSYAERVAHARDRGQVLRYVARIGSDGGTVGLMPVDRSNLLGALRGPGNFVAIHSARYDPDPLVVLGPGAGLAVTAAAILGDIIALARQT
jgi:homoserine dehydrogenase